jgi:hypothetical protein
MGQKERNGLDEPLRNSSLDLGGEVREQRLPGQRTNSPAHHHPPTPSGPPASGA